MTDTPTYKYTTEQVIAALYYMGNRVETDSKNSGLFTMGQEVLKVAVIRYTFHEQGDTPVPPYGLEPDSPPVTISTPDPLAKYGQLPYQTVWLIDRTKANKALRDHFRYAD